MSGLCAELLASRGIEPDRFQAEAFAALDDGQSVLVSAPTSSGKTLVACYAIAQALEHGKRAMYTTPTKALSNQKLDELSRWLGAENVGLLTGDNVIRPAAPVVVMTTEVLRNMIYSGSADLDNLETAILDEVHFLQDPYRGAVWEEIIISAPSHIRLVCLSATVSNADELADWIRRIRGNCASVIETQRPVPLEDRYLVYERSRNRLLDFSVLQTGQANPEVIRLLGRSLPPGAPARRGHRNATRPARPRRIEVIAHLAETKRLPVVYFVFSRQGCDDAAKALTAESAPFSDPAAAQLVRQIAATRTAGLHPRDLAALDYEHWLEMLCHGVAPHHAGLVPAFKEATEECFAAGLLSVVFATETLAVGVNMPARSVVIEQLSRFTGEGFALLTPAEYTQLTGRAGRRGIDTEGYAFTLWNPHTTFTETAELAGSGNYELESSFRPTYNMVANLVAGRSRTEAVDLLERSFAQHRANGRLEEWHTSLEAERKTLREARKRLNSMQGGQSRSGRNQRHRQQQHRRPRTQDRRPNPKVREAQRHVDLAGSIVRRLKEKIKIAQGGLASQLDAICDVLGEFGCVDGWSLTQTGETLKSVFHEADLLVSLCLRDGTFDDLSATQLAAVASCISYEHRSRLPPPAPIYPDTVTRERTHQVMDLADRIAEAEERHKLARSKLPETGFVATAHAWASGSTIEDLWSGETPAGVTLTGGDFVRQMRQLIDLLRRIAESAAMPETRAAAYAACRKLDRGVVAAAVQVEAAEE